MMMMMMRTCVARARRVERFELDVNGRRRRVVARVLHRADVVLELFVRVRIAAGDHERGEARVPLPVLKTEKIGR